MRWYGALLFLLMIYSQILSETVEEMPAPCQITVTFTTHNNMQDTKQQASNTQKAEQTKSAPKSTLKKWFTLVSSATLLSAQLTRFVVFRI